MSAHDKIVGHYIQEFQPQARAERHFFQEKRPTAEAIRLAALSETPNGKRQPHQRRLKRRVLEDAESALQCVATQLERAENFDKIHSIVHNEIREIPGMGELGVYDIAHRIGMHFRREPTKVYLHAGTRIGARRLGVRGDVVEPADLPRAFSTLEASEIEDCLCIFKDYFGPKGLDFEEQRRKGALPMGTHSCTDGTTKRRRRGGCS